METMHPAGTTPPLPGRRLFIAGCITLLIFSTVHLVPFFQSSFVEPTNPLEVEANRALTAVPVDIGPFHSNSAKLVHLLSASYSVLLYFVVALNFAALPSVAATGRLRGIAMVNAIFVAVLLAIALIYQFPPPGVFSLIALVFFVTAFARAGSVRQASGQ
jgi:hypothetical protein